MGRGTRVFHRGLVYPVNNNVQCLWLSHLLNSIRLSQLKMKALRDPAPAHGSTRRAVPCSVGNPGMCQQRLSQVVALFSVGSSSKMGFLFVVNPQFSDLIDNVVVTTDRFMTGLRARTASAPARSSSQGSKPRVAPVPLLWSAALRVHHEIFIQASIEYVILVFLPNLIWLTCWFPESGEAASKAISLTQAYPNICF